MENERISHYELRRPLGAGGMGEVYEAWDFSLERLVALKFLATATAADPVSLARFEREALEAAKLNHPHIAIVHAFERTGPRPFIAMELLSGKSLRSRIDEGPMPIPEALALARDVAAALAFAHGRGTVHRDIKPENLMFDEHGSLKVLDFGLARAAQATRLTMTGTSLGTPAYSAPEAVRGETGPPADVFALGLVLYEMITGRRAFPSEHPMVVMYAIANEEPVPLAELRSDVPPAVQEVVTRLIAKDPAARPTAAETARQLADLTGVLHSSLDLPTPPPPGVTPTPRRRWPLAIGVGGLLAVTGAVFLLLTANGARDRAEAGRLSGLGSAALAERRIDVSHVLVVRGYATPCKTRVLAGGIHTRRQQIVRIDRGSPRGRLASTVERRLVVALRRAARGADGLLVADYGYGAASPELVAAALDPRRRRDLVITVDSRARVERYRGVTACTPNQEELENALGSGPLDDSTVSGAGQELRRRTNARAVLVTRGARGMVLVERGRAPVVIPAWGSEVADVTGAGDTVIAAFTVACIAGGSLADAARLANYAAGLVVAKPGTATTSRAEILDAVRQDHPA